MAKISGPLLDRIDIQMEVPSVPFQELSGLPTGSSSAEMREQVERARQVQADRYAKNRIYCNAQLKSALLGEHCALDKQSRQLLKSSVQQLGLSARAHDKVLRLARTVADVEGAASLAASHLQEAINYRMLDRQL
jgi:magnesium chelatase family protein